MTDLDPALVQEPSAFQTHLDYRLTGWQKDWARIEAPLADFMGNRQGLPHGGVHATLLDTAMGYCGCYTGDPDQKRLCLTLSLNVQYIALARGTRLIADARRTGGGRSTFFAEATVTDDTGALIAKGTGVFRYRR